MENVYLISYYSEADEARLYKIGITKRTVEQRVKDFKTGNPVDFKIHHVHQTERPFKIETKLHQIHNQKHYKGEWFILEKEDIDSFIPLCEKWEGIFDSLKDNTYLQSRNIKY